MKWFKARPPIEHLANYHISDVQAVERHTDPPHWHSRDFIRYADFQDASRSGYVYIASDRACGFVLFSLFDDRIDLDHLAVHPSVRREGIATALLGRVLDHLTHKRREVVATVNERNLPAQLLLRECGFRYRHKLPELYPDGDGYVFRFDARAVEPANRISAWMEG